MIYTYIKFIKSITEAPTGKEYLVVTRHFNENKNIISSILHS